jgi:serine/threonine protein kinase
VNLSVFEERSIIGGSEEVPNEINQRVEDDFLIFVKSIALLNFTEKSRMENEIEKLINLRHPCIAAPIGFVFPIEPGSSQELKIVRLYLEGYSLAKVLYVNPVWWTSTAKAKSVAGIVLGLRFAESFGLVHGGLTVNNILFNSDHCIRIVDFKPILSEAGESENEGEEGTSKTDIHEFASILFEILFQRSAQDETSIPTGIPNFVSQIIETGLKMTSKTKCSFHDIFEILKRNDFRILDDVDSAEVSAFVNWVESTEYPEK